MIRTPEYMKSAMNLYRQGFVPLPSGYISFHNVLAEMDMKQFNVIKDEGLVSDGWMDGMKVRQIVVETKNGFERLRWHTSGSWFRQGAGWVRAYEATEETVKFANEFPGE